MKSKEKLNSYRSMESAEIEAKVLEMRESLMKLNFKKASGQLENSALFRSTKKEIARALTVLSEKGI